MKEGLHNHWNKYIHRIKKVMVGEKKSLIALDMKTGQYQISPDVLNVLRSSLQDIEKQTREEIIPTKALISFNNMNCVVCGIGYHSCSQKGKGYCPTCRAERKSTVYTRAYKARQRARGINPYEKK